MRYIISVRKSLVTDGNIERPRIKVYPPIQSTRTHCKDPVATVSANQYKILDPTGARAKLFDKLNPEGVKVGDILLVRQRNGDPFAGVCLNIRQRGVDTAILLRNQLTRVGVEMWYKVFSPNVEGIEVVQRRAKRARRARLYYMRYARNGGVALTSIILTPFTGSQSTTLDPSRISLLNTSVGSKLSVLELKRRAATRIPGAESMPRASKHRTTSVTRLSIAWRCWGVFDDFPLYFYNFHQVFVGSYEPPGAGSTGILESKASSGLTIRSKTLCSEQLVYFSAMVALSSSVLFTATGCAVSAASAVFGV